jgi:hypothetical protein
VDEPLPKHTVADGAKLHILYTSMNNFNIGKWALPMTVDTVGDQ